MRNNIFYSLGQKSHLAISSVSGLVFQHVMNVADAVPAVCSHPGSDHFVIASFVTGSFKKDFEILSGRC